MTRKCIPEMKSPLHRSAVVNPMIIFALLFIVVALDENRDTVFVLSILQLIVESRALVVQMARYRA